MLRSAYMPDISPRGVRPEIEEVIENFARENERRSRYFGLEEERFGGSIPLEMREGTDYLGRTRFRERYGKIEAEGIDMSSDYYKGLPNSDMPYSMKRLFKEVPIEHELDHVLSERLVQYADVDEETATAVVESVPIYGEFKYNLERGDPDKAAFILFNMTEGIYGEAFKLGVRADQGYQSPIDGGRGYSTFIRDIQRMGSMDKALRQLKKREKNNPNYN